MQEIFVNNEKVKQYFVKNKQSKNYIFQSLECKYEAKVNAGMKYYL